jgi:hypothetical protein
MVSFNRDPHLRAHDRVCEAHGAVAAAQSVLTTQKPLNGELPTIEYLDAVRLLVDAVGEYGDALASLGLILQSMSALHSKPTPLVMRRHFRA